VYFIDPEVVLTTKLCRLFRKIKFQDLDLPAVGSSTTLKSGVLGLDFLTAKSLFNPLKRHCLKVEVGKKVRLI